MKPGARPQDHPPPPPPLPPKERKEHKGLGGGRRRRHRAAGPLPEARRGDWKTLSGGARRAIEVRARDEAGVGDLTGPPFTSALPLGEPTRGLNKKARGGAGDMQSSYAGVGDGEACKTPKTFRGSKLGQHYFTRRVPHIRLAGHTRETKWGIGARGRISSKRNFVGPDPACFTS